MMYYKYDLDYIYVGEIDSPSEINSATTVAPTDATYIKFDPVNNIWRQLPAELTLADMKVNYNLQLINYYNEYIANINSDIANFEESTYATQELEWRAWVADNTAATPYVDILAAKRGLTKEDVMTRIGVKIAYFASIQGELHSFQDQVKAAVDISALKAIAYPWL